MNTTDAEWHATQFRERTERLWDNWDFAYDVVCAVEPGTGGPRTATRVAVKLSAREFAEIAGTSDKRVLRYFKSWEHAAGAGIVPPASEMYPRAPFTPPSFPFKEVFNLNTMESQHEKDFFELLKLLGKQASGGTVKVKELSSKVNLTKKSIRLIIDSARGDYQRALVLLDELSAMSFDVNSVEDLLK